MMDPLRSFILNRKKLSLDILLFSHEKLSYLQLSRGGISTEDVLNSLEVIDRNMNDETLTAHSTLLFECALTPTLNYQGQLQLQVPRELISQRSTFLHSVLNTLRKKFGKERYPELDEFVNEVVAQLESRKVGGEGGGGGGEDRGAPAHAHPLQPNFPVQTTAAMHYPSQPHHQQQHQQQQIDLFLPYARRNLRPHPLVDPRTEPPRPPGDGFTEFERSEPIVRLLAQFRKVGMDILFPQDTHDKILASIFIAVQLATSPAHRELIDMVMAVRDSNRVNQLEHVSKTKVRGVLALLKHGEMLLTHGAEGQPVRLHLAQGIKCFRDLRQRHDSFLSAYMFEHNIFIPETLRAELIWQFDPETTLQRLDLMQHFEGQLQVFFQDYKDSLGEEQQLLPHRPPQQQSGYFEHRQRPQQQHLELQLEQQPGSSSYRESASMAQDFSFGHQSGQLYARSSHPLNPSLSASGGPAHELAVLHSAGNSSASLPSSSTSVLRKLDAHSDGNGKQEVVSSFGVQFDTELHFFDKPIATSERDRDSSNRDKEDRENNGLPVVHALLSQSPPIASPESLSLSAFSTAIDSEGIYSSKLSSNAPIKSHTSDNTISARTATGAFGSIGSDARDRTPPPHSGWMDQSLRTDGSNVLSLSRGSVGGGFTATAISTARTEGITSALSALSTPSPPINGTTTSFSGGLHPTPLSASALVSASASASGSTSGSVVHSQGGGGSAFHTPTAPSDSSVVSSLAEDTPPDFWQAPSNNNDKNNNNSSSNGIASFARDEEREGSGRLNFIHLQQGGDFSAGAAGGGGGYISPCLETQDIDPGAFGLASTTRRGFGLGLGYEPSMNMGMKMSMSSPDRSHSPPPALVDGLSSLLISSPNSAARAALCQSGDTTAVEGYSFYDRNHHQHEQQSQQYAGKDRRVGSAGGVGVGWGGEGGKSSLSSFPLFGGDHNADAREGGTRMFGGPPGLSGITRTTTIDSCGSTTDLLTTGGSLGIAATSTGAFNNSSSPPRNPAPASNASHVNAGGMMGMGGFNNNNNSGGGAIRGAAASGRGTYPHPSLVTPATVVQLPPHLRADRRFDYHPLGRQAGPATVTATAAGNTSSYSGFHGVKGGSGGRGGGYEYDQYPGSIPNNAQPSARGRPPPYGQGYQQNNNFGHSQLNYQTHQHHQRQQQQQQQQQQQMLHQGGGDVGRFPAGNFPRRDVFSSKPAALAAAAGPASSAPGLGPASGAGVGVGTGAGTSNYDAFSGGKGASGDLIERQRRAAQESFGFRGSSTAAATAIAASNAVDRTATSVFYPDSSARQFSDAQNLLFSQPHSNSNSTCSSSGGNGSNGSGGGGGLGFASKGNAA